MQVSAQSFQQQKYCKVTLPKRSNQAPQKMGDTVDGWNPAPVEVGSFSYYL